MKIDVQKVSGIYILNTQQTINATIDEVWNYFSNPDNLNNLTPSDLKFEITTPKCTSTYLGQIIAYKIQLLPQIKTSWITEITHLIPKKMFVDEQRFGPYAMWHHEHHFEEINGNVVMTDIVSYKLPLGFLGRLVTGKIIRKKIKSIFRYRYQAVQVAFN